MFLNKDQLANLGLKKCGDNVLISDKASLYSPHNITIGDNVRVDDFCILSASTEITIGSFVHISCYSSLIGRGRILVGDYCSISGRVSIYSSCDNFVGMGMVNPMVPEKYTYVLDADVIIKDHVVIGCGSIVLPDIILEEGVAVGSMSLINKSPPEWTISRGIPAKVVAERTKSIIKAYEIQLINDVKGRGY